MPLLTCQEVLDFLSDYVEGRLPVAEHARMDEHLAVCPPCVDYLISFQATLAACRSLRSADFAQLPDMPEELVQAILAARKG
jgi:anti-sigma factor RsiW